jgi:radical SAM protein with 4Fe4S-binding SPASM domain
MENYFAKYNKYRKYNDALQMCTAGRKKLGIMSNGDVNPCGIYAHELVIGNIKNESITNIWLESDGMLRFLEKTKLNYPIEECKKCATWEYCDLCPAMSVWGGKGENEPYEKVCEYSRIRKKLMKRWR